MNQPERPRVLVVIPARGGSKGIPRKNLRSLHGRPLMAYAIETARRSTYGPVVLVSSEDDEILSVALALGVIPRRRPRALAEDDVALDAVVFDAYRAVADQWGPFDVVVTMQPTAPLIRVTTLDGAIASLWTNPSLDTVLTAVDDRHLRWEVRDGVARPSYVARLNRQYLPQTYRETGGVFATRAGVLAPSDRIGTNVELVAVDASEGVDIDGADDWALCEWYLGRRDILFVVTGNPLVGLGHANNALAVADALVRHRVRFLVDRESDLAARTIAGRHYDVTVQGARSLEDEAEALGPDVVINDRLDTTDEYVAALKRSGRIVVNFEDLGPGARAADLVINAIYPEREWIPNHYFGHRYYCPRPEFVVATTAEIRDEVRTVLITFGGTDPNNLTRRVLGLIQPLAAGRGIALRVVLGLGYAHEPPVDSEGVTVLHSVANMASQMREADLIFTSAGRTTFEIACVGTPAIVIAQNERELTHLFATADHGFLNLGLAAVVGDDEIVAAFERLVDDLDGRCEMQRRMTIEPLNGGLERVRLLIEGILTT